METNPFSKNAMGSLADILTEKKYRCPSHGDIGQDVIRFQLVESGELKKFCLKCFISMVEQACCEVEEIKKDE